MNRASLILMIFMLFVAGCSLDADEGVRGAMEKATFAGGCFWCMEHPIEELPGVVEVTSGYMGGDVENPSYEAVSSGNTGHREVVQITYDPSKITYEDLLGVFWRNIDPTDPGGQFSDRGTQYKTAIFYHGEDQRMKAEKSKQDLAASGKFDGPVATEILKASKFHQAEDYHQDYSKKNPAGYDLYKKGSGREPYLKKTWGSEPESRDLGASSGYVKPSKEELGEILTPLQYKVTQQDGTERPFVNEYVDNKEEGIYVDVVSGEPLFSSTDKYDSKTGWPSFTKPIKPDNMVEKEDRNLFAVRTEVRSKQADSHLGHIFPDGPEPTGMRYCVNSAALRFIPKDELEKEGYGEYNKLFKE